MQVIFRADDAGSSEGANQAIAETVIHGPVRNVSLMAPGPALSHAYEILAPLQTSFGLHVTLNSEWQSMKWGPVLPRERVASLVGPDGRFTPNPSVLQSQGFSVAEAIAEVAAQLTKLRTFGFEIEYLDEHMGVGWIAGLADALGRFCDAEGLVQASAYPTLQDHACLLAEPSGEESGPVVALFHPGSDRDPVMAEFIHAGLEPGQVHRERIQDRKFLLDPRLLQHGSITYHEAAGAT